ncbi:hypothetical protein B0J18DRAFT_406065 [Chaetomium sp. MPI-SDFR-AT-0129]|nr:hypothetical protein B0J18DRAFT_406065 [Chaetomium sp. MPI-SDFR-AT-0129]
MADRDGDDDQGSRPSFSDFWKKSKEALGGGKKIRFVEGLPGAAAAAASADLINPNSPPTMRPNTKARRRSGHGGNAQPPTGGGAGSSGSPSLNATPADADAALAKDKAQARRAQVRKAQIQHRQRKANYVKQLEMDVARIRETIEAAERDTRALLDENKAMRIRILQAAGGGNGGNTAVPLSLNRGVELLREMPLPTELTSDVGLDMQGASASGIASGEGSRSSATGVTVTLGFDEVMNAPTFYISSPVSSKGIELPPSGPLSPSRQEMETGTGVSPNNNNDLPDLTPSQSQAAINFILALEHLCRDHFHPSDYQPPPPDTVYPIPLIGHAGHGHTLMATSLALQGAPPAIFKAASRSGSNRPGMLLAGAGVTTALSSVAMGAVPRGRAGGCKGRKVGDDVLLAGKGGGGGSGDNANANDDPLSWTASSLTLRALHGIASSLNPNDQVEVTPIQALFELLARFGGGWLESTGVPGSVDDGSDLLLSERLKRELVGVVKCPHYGASMERGAFENVVGRVLGVSY